MTSPYTAAFLDAFMAAQGSVSATVTAAVWWRPLRSRTGTALLVMAIWLATLAIALGVFLSGLEISDRPDFGILCLRGSAILALIALAFTASVPVIAAAGVGATALVGLGIYLEESLPELISLHVVVFAILAAIAVRREHSVRFPSRRDPVQGRAASGWLVDVLLGTAAVALAVLACIVFTHRHTNSADEWGYTFQAAVFAKLRAFAQAPRCSSALETFFVFEWSGKLFSQYTPGWPYFMVPFVMAGVAWLAGPVSFGLLVVAIARLTRRAVRMAGRTEKEQLVASAFAGVCTILGFSFLINGASRYSHVFVAALYAGSVEALLALSSAKEEQDPAQKSAVEWKCGLTLGALAAWMLATRPLDGGALGIGLFVYYLYALIRRRFGWRGLVAPLITFGALGGLTLVILRLQLGAWFQTGYSLNAAIHPWNKVDAFSLPAANQWKWGIPLATGSYCWWPCAPALGFMGLVLLGRGARALKVILALSFLPFFVAYALTETGRGFDLGYGPRYMLPAVVPMAVGGGSLLAGMYMTARSRRWTSALRAGGPFALALAALVTGILRIAPDLYPYTFDDVVVKHNPFQEALQAAHLRNAVVLGGPGLNNTDQLDLTENMPLDLYPNPGVVIALDRGPDSVQCMRHLYPNRIFYRATPTRPVRFVPMK